MKIILQKSHPNLGNKGEVKEVASGFARNFLIPKNIALPADGNNIKRIQGEVERAKSKLKLTLKNLEKIQDQVKGLKLIIKTKVQKGGKLFGSVGKLEVQKALEKKIGVKIPKTKIGLDKAIKKVGEYQVVLNISSKIKPEVKIVIKPLEK